jgi:hypothetical protein
MEMTSEKLHELIDKYFEAETTLEEENDLKSYFSQPNVPPEFEKYKAVFGFWNTQIEEDKALNEKVLLDAIKPKKQLKFEIWSAAAVILVLITALWIWSPQKSANESPKNLYADTYEDPEVARQEVKKLLSMVSNKMNRGNEAFLELEKFSETQQKLIK